MTQEQKKMVDALMMRRRGFRAGPLTPESKGIFLFHSFCKNGSPPFTLCQQ